jgi:hypothetical protein
MKMKAKLTITETCLYFIFLLLANIISSCDNKAFVAIVKNNSNSKITGVTQTTDSISNSVLYKKDVYMDINIEPNEYQVVGIPSFTISELSDSSKFFLLIFNDDSLKKYRTLKDPKDIFRKSLIRKVVIDQPKVKKVLDTIFIK